MAEARVSSLGAMRGAARVIASHPELWSTALRQARVLTPRGWWKHPPFLPVPDATYLRFRMLTAYGGDGTATPDPDDLVVYLRWCRAYPDVIAQG